MGGELGTLRLRVGDNYVIATVGEDGAYHFETCDHIGDPVSAEDRDTGLRLMLKVVSVLRAELWKEINKVSTDDTRAAGGDE